MQTINEIKRLTVRPIQPGEYLSKVLKHVGVSQERLAEAMNTSRFTVNQIVTGKRSVTPSMAMRLSKATNTSIDIWLNLQRSIDLYEAYQSIGSDLDQINPILVRHEVKLWPLTEAGA